MIETLEILDIRLVSPHNMWDSPSIAVVPLLKPRATPANLTSLILHCDVTILSITPEAKDVTAAHLEDLLRELKHV